MPSSSMAGLVPPHLGISRMAAGLKGAFVPFLGVGELGRTWKHQKKKTKTTESDSNPSWFSGMNLVGPRNFGAVRFGTVPANQKAAHDFSIFKNQPIRSSHWLGFKILRYRLFAQKRKKNSTNVDERTTSSFASRYLRRKRLCKILFGDNS